MAQHYQDTIHELYEEFYNTKRRKKKKKQEEKMLANLGRRKKLK